MQRYALESVIAALLIFWLLGAFIAPFGGNFIHLTLALVGVFVVLRVLQRRRAVTTAQ